MMLRNLILAIVLFTLPLSATENVKAFGAVAKANLKAIGAVAEANLKAIGAVDNTGSAFTPASVALTMIQWNEAEDLTGSNNDPYTTWTANGTGVNLSNAGGTTRPLLKTAVTPGGLNALEFDGDDDYLQGANWGAASTQARTTVLRVKYLQSNLYLGYAMDGNSDPGRMGYLSQAATDSYGIYAGGAGVESTITQDTSWHLVITKWNGASTAYSYDGGGFTTVGASPGTETVNGITLGAAYDNSTANGNVQIADVIVYAGSISDADKNSLSTYYSTR